MPSFDADTLAYFTQVNWERNCAEAFARGRPSSRSVAWLTEELSAVEGNIVALTADLKANRLWRKRLRRRLAVHTLEDAP